ncbi:Piso0_001246 [Millerozyma farinosa CBS 7064]|uniref:Piso0_001246 protein n=1 Tax=Pichia sorbitophila (strain ATCC MYA-4447 / BCRC 22081 / CBS 7064 / NBRC 10061 / NRRL Y-12695) TaxID=559304 RepID=G8YMN0_PICSO|nr:Piso0_001246 [Millerozyma farinosa CBS 7064]
MPFLSEGSASIFSHLFSTISLCSWMCAQLPQIFLNYRYKSTEGISPGFLALWALGDLLSLSSCFINDKVMYFQVYLSLFFVSNDLVLCYQYYHYNVKPEHQRSLVTDHSEHTFDGFNRIISGVTRYGCDAEIIHGVAATDNTRSSLPVKGKEVSGVSKTSSSDIHSPDNGSDGYRELDPFKPLHTISIVASSLSSADALSVNLAVRSTRYSSQDKLALFLAWSCTCVYISSRIPQLYKNYRRKSVQGISPLLFGAAVLGNLTYTASILLSPQFVRPDDRMEFLVKQIPYIVGSSGTVFFDYLYFYQRYLYHERRTENFSMNNWHGQVE